MDATPPSDDAQAALWNGAAGRAWVEAQALLDAMFRPLEDLLLAEVFAELPAGRGGEVLDVGCGAGSTALAVQRRLGAGGHCVGIDISAPLIAAARARAEREGSPATFIRADAQTHPFAPARFDAILSRFGVMFFADPVRAFANLRRAARDGAALRCVAWRSAAENPFMTTAERAAAPLLPLLPLVPAPRASRPDGPGQFAFADPQRVRGVLAASGWAGVAVRPVDVTCTLPTGALVEYLTRLGPLGRALHDADERTRARVVDAVRPAFEPYVHGAQVRFTAACWMVGARAAPAAAAAGS